MSTVRKNITMSKDIAEWFEIRSKELGVPQSSLMTMALDSYITQAKSLTMGDTLKELLSKVNSETP